MFVFWANDKGHSWSYSSHNFPKSGDEDIMQLLRRAAGIKGDKATTEVSDISLMIIRPSCAVSSRCMCTSYGISCRTARTAVETEDLKRVWGQIRAYKLTASSTLS